jgi:ankyrin repeat protein
MNVRLIFLLFLALTSASSDIFSEDSTRSISRISEKVKNEASKIPTLYEMILTSLMDQLSLTSDYTAVLQILELKMNVPSFPDGSNMLHFASKRLLIDLIRVAIDSEQFDINAVDTADKKCTALLHACYGTGTKNHEMGGDSAKEAVKLLLSVEGINVNATDRYGRTSLIIASANGHSEVVQLFLGVKGINVNAFDKNGRTSLILASANGHSKVVKLLIIAKETDVNATDKYGYTSLSLASSNGNYEVVKLLLGVEGINVNAFDKYGRTSLMRASANGHSDVVDLLLSVEGINVDAKDNYGRSSLNLASENGHYEVVKMLLGVDTGFSLVSFLLLLSYFVYYLIQYRA